MQTISLSNGFEVDVPDGITAESNPDYFAELERRFVPEQDPLANPSVHEGWRTEPQSNNPIKMLGAGIGEVGRFALGAAADVVGTVAGFPEYTGNVKRWAQGKDTPFEIAQQESTQAGQTSGRFANPNWDIVPRVASSFIESIPKLAALAAVPELATPKLTLLAHSIASGGLFGLDANGDWNTKAGVVGFFLPGVGKAASVGTAMALTKAVQGGATALAKSPMAQKLIETLGSQVALDAAMTVADAPELMKEYADDPRKAKAHLAEIVGSNLIFAFLGLPSLRKGVPSETQKFVHDHIEKYQDIAEQMLGELTVPGVDRRAVISELQSRAGLAQPAEDQNNARFWRGYTPGPGAESDRFATVGEPNADSQPTPVEIPRGQPPGSSPQIPKGVPSEILKPTEPNRQAPAPPGNVNAETVAAPVAPATFPEAQAKSADEVAAAPVPIAPDMPTARRVIGMTPKEFQAAFPGGFNKVNLALAESATPADVAELKALRDQAQQRQDAAKAALAKTKTVENLNEQAAAGSIFQFYNEAINAAEARLAPKPPTESPATRWAVFHEGEPYSNHASEAQARMVASGLSGNVEVRPIDTMAPAAPPPTNIVPFPTPEPPPSSTALDPSKSPVVEIPVAKIKLSKDVPNFKAGANPETGVVPGDELKGKTYERVGTAPIVVWQRLNGDLEVITGRHKLDLARRLGEETIPGQIVKEADGWTQARAARLDAEANIRDGNGTVADYANFFKHSPELDRATAEARGLLSRAKGRAGFSLGRDATDGLYDLYRNDKIGEAEAVAIAETAPGDEALQRVGIKQALKGRKADELRNEMAAAKVLTSTVKADQMDMWGADDSAIVQMEKMAAIARAKQKDIQADISAISGTSKNPERAKKLGVDIGDPEAVRAKLVELYRDKQRWDNWSQDAELVRAIRAETTAKPDSKPDPVSPKVPADIKQGDTVSFMPSAKVGKEVRGVVQEIINDRDGLNIFSPAPGDPTRVVRVWMQDGKLTKQGNDLTLAAPETVEEQKARLAKEDAAKKEADAKAKLAEAAAKPLKGTAGDIGQGDLLGTPEPDLFAPPSGAQTLKSKANALADKLEGLKANFQPEKGELGLFGVIPKVWDAAVSAAQAVIRAGGTVADAIAKAIEHIKANFTGTWDEAGATAHLGDAFREGPPPIEEQRYRAQKRRERNRKVFGAQIGAMAEIEGRAEQTQVIKDQYFDGQKPATPERTDQAWKLFEDLTGPNKGAHADAVQKLVKDITQQKSADAAPTLMEVELAAYGLQLAASGDVSLLRAIALNDQKFASGGGTSQLDARALAARQEFSSKPFWQNLKRITEDRARVLGKKYGGGADLFNAMMRSLEQLKMTPEEVAAEFTKEKAAGRSIADIFGTPESDDPLLTIISRLTLPVPSEVHFKAAKSLADRIMGMFPLMEMRRKLGEGGGKQLADSWWALLAEPSNEKEGHLYTANKALQSELGGILREALVKAGIVPENKQPKATDFEKLAMVQGKGQLRSEKFNVADEMVRAELDRRRGEELDRTGDDEAKAESINTKYDQLDALWDDASTALNKNVASDRTLRRMVHGELKEQGVKWGETFGEKKDVGEIKRRIVSELLRKTREVSTSELKPEIKTAFDNAFDQVHDAARAKWEINEASKRDREAQRRAKQRAPGNQGEAERILDTMEKQQGAEWLKPDQISPVRAIVKEFLSDKDANGVPWHPLVASDLRNDLGRELGDLRGGFRNEMEDRLRAVGVSDDVARELAWVTFNEASAKFASKRTAQVNRATEGWNIRALTEAILQTPYRAQHDPAWRLETATRWLESNGLEHDQAVQAAKQFSDRFDDAMRTAGEKEARRLMEGKLTADKINDVVRAIRLGLTDPNKVWADSLAIPEGFKPLTPEMQQRISELELKRFDPSLSPAELSALNEQMMGIWRQSGKVDGVVLRRISELGVGDLLSGLPTLFVQFTPLVESIRNFSIEAVRDPMSARGLFRAMYNAYKDNFALHLKYSWQTKAYGFHLTEITREHEQLQTWWENLNREYPTASVKRKMAIRVSQIYAAVHYVNRILSTADQAFMAATREYKLAYYANSAFRMAGIKTREIDRIVQVMATIKQLEYEKAIELGATDREAKIRASHTAGEVLRQFIGDPSLRPELAGSIPALENRPGKNGQLKSGIGMQLAADMLKSAEMDTYSTTGRLAEGIKETDEGMISRLLPNEILKWISSMRGQGGLKPMLTTQLFGFVNIPYRSMRYAANFFGYGLARYPINEWARNKPELGALYKQSYANDLQAKQRLREAIAGTITLGLAYAWTVHHSTADDGAGDDKFGIYVTGNGPKGKDERDLWLKQGWAPYAINFVVAGHKKSIPLTRAGEAIMFPFVLPAAGDDARWAVKEAAAKGKKLEYSSVLAQTIIGEFWYMMGQRGALQTLGSIGKVLGGESGALKAAAKQLAGVVTAPAVPFKQLLASISGMMVGPLDTSTASSLMINQLPLINQLPWAAGKAYGAVTGQPTNWDITSPAINRFGDQIGDQTWYGKVTRTGTLFAFQVSKTPENVRLYNDILLQKGASPPELRRYIVEERFGPMTNDEFAKFGQISGDFLKKATLASADSLKNAAPQQVEAFLAQAAHGGDAAAAAQLHLAPIKPPTSANVAASGGSGGGSGGASIATGVAATGLSAIPAQRGVGGVARAATGGGVGPSALAPGRAGAGTRVRLTTGRLRAPGARSGRSPRIVLGKVRTRRPAIPRIRLGNKRPRVRLKV